MTSNNLTATAYILHQRPYRNTSSILRLLVEGKGLIEGVYRGGQSRGLQLFTPYWLYCQSREGLSRINKLEPLEKTYPLTDKSLLCALYVNELLVKLLRQFDAQQDIFSLYQQALGALTKPSQLDVTLRRFEIALLKELGFALMFDRESHTHYPIEEKSTYCFYPDSGFIKKTTSKSVERAFLGQDLLAISRDNYALPSTRRTAKLIMREMVDYLLNGKVLQSRELFLGV